MNEPEDWRQRIVQMVLVKQKIAELDTQQLWEYRLPKVAATQEKLCAAEAQLGEPLDSAYREFLSYADGWPAFFHAMDLFGTDDLIGDRVREATEMLSYIDDVVFDGSGLRREELLPIGLNTNDMDIFVMTRRSASKPGVVIWLAGGEIDRWGNFDDYFLAMVDYNRLEVQNLISKTN